MTFTQFLLILGNIYIAQSIGTNNKLCLWVGLGYLFAAIAVSTAELVAKVGGAA